jgi:choline kinase
MLPKAVILVAGRGRRLLPQTQSCPKCLLPIGESTILDHQLYNLCNVGFEEVVLVCGFGADKIRLAAAEFGGRMNIQIVVNQRFAVGDNLISLWAARHTLDRSFVLLNGDNLFHPNILESVTRSEDPCCLMIGRKDCYDDDDMKVRTVGTRIVEIGKELDPLTADAESIGIMRFASDAVHALKERLKGIISSNHETECCYLTAVQAMINSSYPVNFRDAGNLPWADIDTCDDLSFARTHLSMFSQAANDWLEPA